METIKLEARLVGEFMTATISIGEASRVFSARMLKGFVIQPVDCQPFKFHERKLLVAAWDFLHRSGGV